VHYHNTLNFFQISLFHFPTTRIPWQPNSVSYANATIEIRIAKIQLWNVRSPGKPI
jgi:hypothetical protein